MAYVVMAYRVMYLGLHLARELAQHAQELGRMWFPPQSIHYIVMAYLGMKLRPIYLFVCLFVRANDSTVCLLAALLPRLRYTRCIYSYGPCTYGLYVRLRVCTMRMYLSITLRES